MLHLLLSPLAPKGEPQRRVKAGDFAGEGANKSPL